MLAVLPEGEALEDRAADKFAQERVVGDKVFTDRQKPLQEGEQAFGLNVFGGPEDHLAQQRLGHQSKRRKLVNQGRVEHLICVLLVGENVLLLPTADRFPVANGLLGGVAAVASVADDAAEQTGVGGGNAVVPVEIQLS